jgi:hypothetical protein
LSLHTTATTSTEPDTSKGQTKEVLQRISQYIILAAIGILGGAIGVALAIAAVIAIQLYFFPTTAFPPNATLLTLIATMTGAIISWLLGQGGRRFMSDIFQGLAEQGLQVILVFSILASLLQSLLFTHSF